MTDVHFLVILLFVPMFVSRDLRQHSVSWSKCMRTTHFLGPRSSPTVSDILIPYILSNFSGVATLNTVTLLASLPTLVTVADRIANVYTPGRCTPATTCFHDALALPCSRPLQRSISARAGPNSHRLISSPPSPQPTILLSSFCFPYFLCTLSRSLKQFLSQ